MIKWICLRVHEKIYLHHQLNIIKNLYVWFYFRLLSIKLFGIVFSLSLSLSLTFLYVACCQSDLSIYHVMIKLNKYFQYTFFLLFFLVEPISLFNDYYYLKKWEICQLCLITTNINWFGALKSFELYLAKKCIRKHHCTKFICICPRLK